MEPLSTSTNFEQFLKEGRLDLESFEAASGASPSTLSDATPGVASSEESEYRFALAKGMVVLLGGLLAGIPVTFTLAPVVGFDVMAAKDMYITVFTTMATLVGSAMGFYFGGHKK